MINKKYPLIVFGIIGAYHITTHFMNLDLEKNREETRAKAEAERQERLKQI